MCGYGVRTRERARLYKARTRRDDSDLCAFFLKSLEYRLKRGVAEAAVDTTLFVVLESGAESFRTVIECIAEGFMDASKAGREDLSKHLSVASVGPS